LAGHGGGRRITEACGPSCCGTLIPVERYDSAEPGPDAAPLDQGQSTTACMIRYVRMADPDLLPPSRDTSLDALSERCEAFPELQATLPAAYVLPSNA
jgi:hypothetical protein